MYVAYKRCGGRVAVPDLLELRDAGTSFFDEKVMVTEDVCEKVVEVRRISDRLMVVVMLYGKQLVRIVCAYAPQAGLEEAVKDKFMTA